MTDPAYQPTDDLQSTAVAPQQPPAMTPVQSTEPTAVPTPALPTDPGTATDPFAGAVLQDLATPAPSQPVTPGRRKELASPTIESPVSTAAEAPATTESLIVAPPEVASSASTEVEPARELGPEIEKTIERIEQHKVAATQETAVQADHAPTSQPNTVSQPVVVLPLSEQAMSQGKSKNTSFSVRWLYEWSVRQIKKFADTLVVYRE